MSDPEYVITKRLEDILQELTKKASTPQSVVAVESGDLSFRWLGVRGNTASGDPVSGDTPVFLASIDKMYNAAVVMKLSENGRLNIDDPIETYLPPSITRGLHRCEGRDLSGQITVRHLLTHTSGLADWLEDYPQGGPSLIESVLAEGDRQLTIEELASHVRDRLKPHFPPQDLKAKRPKARYSDTNFMLVIAIIEAVTGQPLHEVHQNMLHEPLGLRQTYFPGSSPTPGHPVEAMTLRARGTPLQIPQLLSSVRGIYSSVGDMLKFKRGFIRGELFQHPETLTAMQSDWRRFGLPRDRAALRSPGWPIEYATGLMRFRLPRMFTPAAPMPSVVGHTGSTGCWLFYCPSLDVYLAGSVDEVTAGAVPFRTVPKILNAVRKLHRTADA